MEAGCSVVGEYIGRELSVGSIVRFDSSTFEFMKEWGRSVCFAIVYNREIREGLSIWLETGD